MTLCACSLMLVVTLANGAGATAVPAASAPLTTTLADASTQRLPGSLAKPEVWMLDRDVKRPAALPLLYATLGALNAFDVYSTRQALDNGAQELNPVMRKAGNSGAMLAVKALSTAGTIYFTERAWKKNRKGAVVLAALINGVTAAIVARNMSHAR